MTCASPAPSGVAVEPAATPELKEPFEFSFVAVDGTAVTSEGTRNRNTIFVFVTTYDIASFAQVKALGRVLREHRPRVNGVVIALDPQQNRAIVEAFAASLPFPVVHADAATRARPGPMPTKVVPSVMILDREGRPRFRYLGLAEPSVLERALRPLD